MNEAMFSIVANIVADVRSQLDYVMDLITCPAVSSRGSRGRCTLIVDHKGMHLNASGDGWETENA